MEAKLNKIDRYKNSTLVLYSCKQQKSGSNFEI